MNLESRNFRPIMTDGSDGFHCGICNSRCTKSQIESAEFGYKVGCPQGALSELMQLAEAQGSVTAAEIPDVLTTAEVPTRATGWSAVSNSA